MMMELVLGKKPYSKSSIRELAQSRDKGKDNNKVALTVANKTATRSHMEFDDEKTATMFITWWLVEFDSLVSSAGRPQLACAVTLLSRKATLSAAQHRKESGALVSCWAAAFHMYITLPKLRWQLSQISMVTLTVTQSGLSFSFFCTTSSRYLCDEVWPVWVLLSGPLSIVMFEENWLSYSRGRLHDCRSHLKHPMVCNRWQPEQQRLCQPAPVLLQRSTRQSQPQSGCCSAGPAFQSCLRSSSVTSALTRRWESIVTPTWGIASLMCCTAACMKFLVGWSYICSSRRTSSCLFVQKVVNIFFCTVWSLLICTPAVTHAEINHLGLSLNPCEWPAVSLWPSSTRFSLYISESCFVKTSVFALQHVSTTKLKYSVGFVGRVPSFFIHRAEFHLFLFLGASLAWQAALSPIVQVLPGWIFLYCSWILSCSWNCNVVSQFFKQSICRHLKLWTSNIVRITSFSFSLLPSVASSAVH